ncbi:MAG TPA: DUF3443 domain-containing protein [Polyangiaceae bacterium]
MKSARIFWLAAVPVVAIACGGGGGKGGGTGGDGGTESGGSSGGGSSGGGSSGSGEGGTGEGGSSGGANSVPMTVNSGPSGAAAVDVPFISITLCIPGTTTCQTIDSVSVDTGSTGLRVQASTIGGLALPQANASTGSPLAECYSFADGYTWGSVRNADVHIGGEVAKNVPLQLIGDPGFTSIPADCSSTGVPENTVADFGANALIGINQAIPDCGSYCLSASGTGSYYSCSGSTCASVGVPIAAQVSNVIASFATDNNGAILELPTIAAAGVVSSTGSLVFGIGTQANNALGSATVLTVDASGNFSTTYNGTVMPTSFLDSGTNSFSFNDTAITPCTGAISGFYCPATTLSLSAQNKGTAGTTSSVSFSLESAETLFNTNATAFDDLGTSGLDNATFDWGLPFFFGRNVFVAIDGASTPGGNGPYFAY